MDISARVDYAVRAMLILAEADAEGAAPISIDTLSTRQELPRKFLEAIFADLRRADLVLSRRGARGGYVLARERGAISVGDVFRAVDAPTVGAPGRLDGREGHGRSQGDWPARRAAREVRARLHRGS